jgi:hypothetical protein
MVEQKGCQVIDREGHLQTIYYHMPLQYKDTGIINQDMKMGILLSKGGNQPGGTVLADFIVGGII